MQTTSTSTLICIIIVMNVISVILVNGFLDYKIIDSYFKEKPIHYGIIIGCFSNKTHLATTKYFASKGQISILNINRIKLSESLKIEHGHVGVVLDGDCDNVQDFLIHSGSRKYFDVRRHWLVLSSTKSFLSNFETVALYINADIQVVYPEKKSRDVLKNYTIEDVYNPSYERGGELKHYPIGFYNEREGYTVKERRCKYWLRRNMTGVTLKSIIVLPVPYEGELKSYLNSERHKEINTFNRFHYNLMRSCELYYNFTANVTCSKSWGYKNRDDTFDGLVGALERKIVDYGSSPLFVRTDRSQVMEYGRRTWTLRAAFIFRNPKSRNSVEIFVKPLSLSVWMLILCSATMVVFSFRLSYLYEMKNVKEQIEASWSYMVICITGALCQQGMTKTPYFLSGRIVMLFMFLFSLLIYQFYSASLVSHLLMKSKSRIKTVRDILESNMRVGCEDILYNRDYFLHTTDKPSQELYRRKILGKKNGSNFLQPEDGLSLVSEGRYAFHVELATAYPLIRKTFDDRVICDLQEVQMYRTQPMHANLQKKSPYRDMFDTCLQRLAEYGIMSREIIFWHPPKPECIRSSKTTLFGIGLDDFYPALGILAVGIVFSLFVLTIEILVNYKNAPNNNKINMTVIRPFVQ